MWQKIRKHITAPILIAFGGGVVGIALSEVGWLTIMITRVVTIAGAIAFAVGIVAGSGF